jgi:hypothetical protein
MRRGKHTPTGLVGEGHAREAVALPLLCHVVHMSYSWGVNMRHKLRNWFIMLSTSQA